MKFNVSWLSEILEQPFDSEQLAEQLTSAGLEAGGVEPASQPFSDVVIAKVVACEPHPDADRLRVCRVDYGAEETVQIVCGAPNVRTGLFTPLAKVGACLPGDFKIKPAKLRGVESYGMLCSGKELGLDDDSDGLKELTDTAPIGTNLRDWMQLDDTIIELELTPNRADCLSLRGLAREVCAIQRHTYNPELPVIIPVQTETTVQINIDNPADCPRYAVRAIEGLDIHAKTPAWMQERLRRCGLRSKSPLVDVTNYVLLELGQPLHAFDLELLRKEGDQLPVLGVRRAHVGEKLTLLNDQHVELNERHLVITADDQPEALAGLMGGASTAVRDETTHVLLESAWFNPSMIMGRSRDLGVSSDAAHRFERGIDPDIQLLALERATELLISIAGGKVGPICIQEYRNQLPQQKDIRFRLARCNALLGLELSAEQVLAILESLGMSVVQESTEVWLVCAPSARLDIALEVDLIEEVARLHGYDQIPDQLPAGALALQAQPEKQLPKRRLESQCVDLGYQEAVSYSFVDESLLTAFDMQDNTLKLANPISQELAVMRPALVPGLVSVVQRNLRKYSGAQRGTVRMFEIGTVFSAGEGDGVEQQRLAFAACGRQYPQQWQVTESHIDFFAFKGDIEAALGHTVGELKFEVSDVACLHPGQAADILLVTIENGQEQTTKIGWMGLLHPQLRKTLDINSPVFVAELQFDQVVSGTVPNFKKTSKFPSIRRDLALIVPNDLPAQAVLDYVRKHADETLKSAFLFDVYVGSGIESGYKSLAIGLILQDHCQTLTDEAADSNISRILSGLEKDGNIRLRD